MNNQEDEKLHKAIICFENGELQASEKILNKILAKNSKHLVSLQVLAIIFIQQSKFTYAVDLLKRAFLLDPFNGSILLNLGKALLEIGDGKESARYIKKLLELDPNNINALLAFGDACVLLKDYEEAIEVYKKCISLDSNSITAYLGLGYLYFNSHKHDASISICSHIISTLPSDDRAWDLLIANYMHLEDLVKAESAVKEALVATSSQVKFLVKKGEIHLEKSESALAANYFKDAIALNERYDSAWVGLGNVLNFESRYTEALEAFARAIQINPMNKEAFCSQGCVYKNIGDYESASIHFKRAASIGEDYPLALYNKAHIDLALFRFRSGWSNYESRWRVSGFGSSPIATNKPTWDGQNYLGKLLVWPEQGIGDQILFGSLLSKLESKVSKLIVQIDPKLLSIFRRSFPNIDFYSKDIPADEINFDKHIAIGSLGKYLINSTVDLVKSNAYLLADKSASNKFRDVLKSGNKLICGISWASKGARYSEEKTYSLLELLPLLTQLNCTYVDVGYVDTADEREYLFKNFGIKILKINEIDSFSNLDGLASVINACDLVISTSNTSAHIAGSLGRETYLLSPGYRGKFWYWHDVDGHSPWYPTIKILNGIHNVGFTNLAKDIISGVKVDGR